MQEKHQIQGNSENTEQGNTKTKTNLKIVVPLKHLSSFLRTLDMPCELDNTCEVSLTLTWSENCVLADITTQIARNANVNTDPPVEPRERIDAPTTGTFQIKDTKLYVAVVTPSTQDDNKFLEKLKSGFKKTIKWNKYRAK